MSIWRTRRLGQDFWAQEVPTRVRLGNGYVSFISFHDYTTQKSHIPLTDYRISIVATWNTTDLEITQTAEYDPNGITMLYGPTGNLLCDNGHCPNVSNLPFGFTSALRSEVTGLIHMRARWYSPQLGQFISPDPLGYIDSYNLYSYAKFDPINNWDPYGQSSKGVADTSNLKNPLTVGKYAFHEGWYGIFLHIDCGIRGKCHADVMKGARGERQDAKARGAVKGTGDGLLNLTLIIPLLNMENDKVGASPYFPPNGADEEIGHFTASFGIGVYAGVFTFAALPSFPKTGKLAARTRSFTEKNKGTDLIRSTEINGIPYEISSGHGYNRPHRTGDLRQSGLSMDTIENAILDDLIGYQKHNGIIPTIGPGFSGPLN